MEKNPGVPEYAKIIEDTALIAWAKDGLATTLKSETQAVSVCGAEAGRSWTPTAMITMKTRRACYETVGIVRVDAYGGALLATMIHGRPIHASQVIRPRVRILAQRNPTTAAMATNTAVQTPWVETAFSPMEMPSIADPVTNIQYVGMSGIHTSVYIWQGRRTETEGSSKNSPADQAKHQLPSIVNTIHLWML